MILWRSLIDRSARLRPQRQVGIAIRDARTSDAGAIAAIYAEGVLSRAATFDTTAPRPESFAETLGIQLTLVAEVDGAVIGWARLGPYMPSRAGIGLYQLYVASSARRRGVGGALLAALVQRAEASGYFKVVGRMLAINQPALRAAHGCGFRTVGVLRRHGKIDGEWHDVIEVERLLGEAAAG